MQSIIAATGYSLWWSLTLSSFVISWTSRDFLSSKEAHKCPGCQCQNTWLASMVTLHILGTTFRTKCVTSQSRQTCPLTSKTRLKMIYWRRVSSTRTTFENWNWANRPLRAASKTFLKSKSHKTKSLLTLESRLLNCEIWNRKNLNNPPNNIKDNAHRINKY